MSKAEGGGEVRKRNWGHRQGLLAWGDFGRGTGAQRGPRRRLTSEVALLSEGDPQVAVVAAKAVSEEGREGGRVLPQELPPPGQLLQGQVRSE